MQSFRTEIENPIVEKDIIELEKKIRLFREGKIDPEKFRTLRLARGVYGQRQQGVQMIRIKIPFGRINHQQLIRIADIADEYSNGNLHLTTRQDVQLHFISLDKTPEIWAKLEQDNITLREACGNTVRNITASAEAGIDKDEPFDVSPYAHQLFAYFLRKPFCQELGRKIKIAFSSSERDTAFTFIHDLGFIPKIRIVDGKEQKGFKIVIAGGLGAQPVLAHTVHEFLEAEYIVSYTESVLRVFDRYGERANRNKARLKYLVAKLGLPEFIKLLDAEQKAIGFTSEPVPELESAVIPAETYETILPEALHEKFELWKSTNVRKQKQPEYLSVYVRIQLGNISSQQTRNFVRIVSKYASSDIRITNTQSFLLKYVLPQNLPTLFLELYSIGLALPGYDSVGDITACPGTDTCNLAIANSTAISVELENLVAQQFPQFLVNNEIKIKISGCMNSCGQHGLASIGFHGSSIKAGTKTVPAVQLLLGGAALGNGEGRIAEKVIKVPTKRAPSLLKAILNDYESNREVEELFYEYYDRQGKMYFYHLLKEFADASTIGADELIDWGKEEKFQTAIGVGECAGVTIDLVQTLFIEADEKYEAAGESILNKFYADGIYQVYSSLINAAKGLLISKGIEVNTQIGILNRFDEEFGQRNPFRGWGKFSDFVLEINKNEPQADFAGSYYLHANVWLQAINDYHANEKIKNNETVKFDL